MVSIKSLNEILGGLPFKKDIPESDVTDTP